MIEGRVVVWADSYAALEQLGKFVVTCWVDRQYNRSPDDKKEYKNALCGIRVPRAPPRKKLSVPVYDATDEIPNQRRSCLRRGRESSIPYGMIHQDLHNVVRRLFSSR